MNDIDFMPRAFVRAQARQRRVVRQAVLLSIVVACIVAWFFATRRDVIDLERFAQTLETQATVQQRHVDEITKLQRVSVTLDQQLRVQRLLGQPIGVAPVIATIARLTPEAVSLNVMTISGPRPEPELREDAPAGRRQKSKARHAADSGPPVLNIDLVGVASRDADIANLVGALTEHPLFVGVKLRYTRSTELQNLIVREFHVEMEVPLNRHYRDERERQEVADAH